jgi:hypothetical protein
MPAKRTVDPTGKDRSTKMIALRITTAQADTMQRLCQERGISRSALIRQLLQNEVSRG